jgi:hypothetical protein
MTKRSALTLVGLLSFPGFLLVGGCGHDDMGMSNMQATTSRLQAREDAHHAAVSAANDADTIRNETAQYETDMQNMMGDMETACSEMMGNGMMGSNTQEACGMTDGMMTAVSDHRDRTESMTDVETMKAECVEHHQVMGATLDTMGESCCGGMM